MVKICQKSKTVKTYKSVSRWELGIDPMLGRILPIGSEQYHCDIRMDHIHYEQWLFSISIRGHLKIVFISTKIIKYGACYIRLNSENPAFSFFRLETSNFRQNHNLNGFQELFLNLRYPKIPAKYNFVRFFILASNRQFQENHDLGWIIWNFTFRKAPKTHPRYNFAQSGNFQAGNQEPENSQNSP